MSDWQPIEYARKDGRLLDVAWFSEGRLEHGPVVTYWHDDEWDGGWTPTHWRVRTGALRYPKGKLVEETKESA